MEARLTQVVVAVSDMRRSVAFYRDALGLAVREEGEWWSELEAGPGVVVGLTPAGGVESAPPLPTAAPGSAFVSFEVPDIQRAVAELRDRGMEVSDPERGEGMPSDSAHLRDPDGFHIQLIQQV